MPLAVTQGGLGSVTEVILGELNRVLLVAIPLPVFELGGMYAGVFTTAAAGAWLALLVAVVVHRAVGLRAPWDASDAACPVSALLSAIAIILITTPVILPAMIHLQINLIWYGVLLVINLELAQITPPVGMNLFTIKAITRSPLGPIVRGCVP